MAKKTKMFLLAVGVMVLGLLGGCVANDTDRNYTYEHSTEFFQTNETNENYTYEYAEDFLINDTSLIDESFTVECYGRVGYYKHFGELQPIIFSSKEETKDFYKKHKEAFITGYSDYTTYYNKTLIDKKYNKTFFKDRILFFFTITEGSGSIYHSIEAVHLTNGVLTVEVIRVLPGGTFDMGYRYFILSLDKSMYSKEICINILDSTQQEEFEKSLEGEGLFEEKGIFRKGPLIYQALDDITVEVARPYRFEEMNGNIDIPDSVKYNGKTYQVVSIGDRAFESCRNLTSVTIPYGVESIGADAFSWCENLIDISIPDSVTSIGEWVFYNCESLTSITIPNSITSIGDWTFNGCKNLTSITIPDNIAYIGSFAFSGTPWLANFLDDFVIVNSILIEYKGNESEVIIPDGVTFVGCHAFHRPRGNTTLTRVTIPNGVTNIGKSAFSGCENLSYVSIPDSLTHIDNDAFENCENLTDIFIPDGVTAIEYRAFAGCTRLTSVEIPDSVSYIGGYVFSRCNNLKTASVPFGIDIDSSAFPDSTNITYRWLWYRLK